MRCVMQHARTPKFQLSGPTVHSLYCDLDVEVDMSFFILALNVLVLRLDLVLTQSSSLTIVDIMLNHIKYWLSAKDDE